MKEENKNQDPDLSAAVDDITATEADEMLKHDDEKIAAAFSDNRPRSFGRKLADFFRDLWENPKKRKIVIISSVVLIAVLVIVPHSRYFILNTAGVRSSASVKVLDESTGQPLKNVTVVIGKSEVKTDDSGVAKLEHLKLGSSQLTIKKRAFAESSQGVTIGWGSNPMGERKLKPVGVQYSFDVKDFLSTKPVEKAEAVSGEYSAFSDQNGRVVLTIDQPGEEVINITIKANGYREEPVDQAAENKSVQAVALVPDRKHVFVSKRSGKYDVYKVDVDGKNEQLVLSGTGLEREDITLVAHPDKNMAALVSTRDNMRNKDGFLLSTLTLIDLSSDDVSTSTITKSERVQIVGWSGDQLVYVKIADGASAANPDRHRLVTYNISTGQSKEIAKTNYFNDVLMAGDDIYFAPSGVYQNEPVGFYKANSKGENQKTIYDQEVWNIFRTDYNKIAFSVQNKWYEMSLNDTRVLAMSGPPAVQLTRVYIDAPDKKHSLWVDQRDGKGALLAYDTESREDKIIKTQSGLTYPLRWLNDSTIVYRINSEQETADYVVSLNGGEPKKIKDVTNTGGIDRWYYY